MQYHFEKLIVWQKGMELVKRIYEGTKEFPKEELYGLASQMRRAAVSVPANIAEGKGRGHTKEFLQFLHTAQGSLFEEMTLIQAARQLRYLNEEASEDLLRLCGESTALLTGLIKSVQ